MKIQVIARKSKKKVIILRCHAGMRWPTKTGHCYWTASHFFATTVISFFLIVRVSHGIWGAAETRGQERVYGKKNILYSENQARRRGFNPQEMTLTSFRATPPYRPLDRSGQPQTPAIMDDQSKKLHSLCQTCLPLRRYPHRVSYVYAPYIKYLEKMFQDISLTVQREKDKYYTKIVITLIYIYYTWLAY